MKTKLRRVMNTYLAKAEVVELEDIYREYHKNVYNYISFRINNHHDSEELTSHVFEKLLLTWHRYDHNKPIEAWLITIAKNSVTDYLRKRRNFAPIEAMMKLSSKNKAPEEVALLNESNRELMEGMAKLSQKDRGLLAMKFATDLDNQEIAELVGMSPNNAAVAIHRALKRLKKIMEVSYE